MTRYRLLTAILPSVLILAGCRSSSAPVQAGPPARIDLVAGNGQSAAVGTVPAVSPAFVIRDASGIAVSGIPVRFVVTQGDGLLTLGDSTASDAEGRVILEGWRLGGVVGQQRVRAAVIGQPIEREVSINSVAGPAAVMQTVAGTNLLAGVVGSPVAISPAVRLRDNYGNPVVGVTVTWSVTAGGGTITGPTTSTSDQSGIAALSGWTLGPVPGENRVQASTVGGLLTVFQATGVDLPSDMVPVTPTSQNGTTHFQVPVLPQVRVTDGSGQAIGGIPVEFTAVEGGGTVSEGLAITGSDGVAAPRDWKLGGGPVQRLRASVAGGLSTEFTVSAANRPFTIDLRFIGTISADQRDAVVAAAAAWMDVIVGDLPDQAVNIAANYCGIQAQSPALQQTVDDMVIFAALVEDDGPGGVAGRAYPCLVRSSSSLTVVGHIELDRADAGRLLTSNQFTRLAMHELGHALGMTSSIWQTRNLLVGAGSNDPHFTGTNARGAFPLLGIPYAGQKVPVENTGGAGTRDSHWRESVMVRELMTGWLEPSGVSMPLTAVTVGALDDMGYQVDYAAAEPYQVGGARLSDLLAAVNRTRIVEEIVDPAGRVLPDGTIIPFIP